MLVEVLRHVEDEQLCMNVLQCISNVAESVECRELLHVVHVESVLQQIQDKSVSAVIDRSVAQAVRTVGFHNWPQ